MARVGYAVDSSQMTHMETRMRYELTRADAAFLAANHADFLELLRDSVAHGASVNFVMPLTDDVNRAYWQRVTDEVAAGTRIVVAAVAEGRVVGCAHLVPAGTPNGHHRAEVQKVLVHTSARRQGIAQALMRAVEDEARTLGRWLLVLDTEDGSDAVGLYEKAGYTRCGGVPEFALSADGSIYRANVYYYKRL